MSLYCADPSLTQKDIADRLGKHFQAINRIFRTNRFLDAITKSTRTEFKSLGPKALHSFKHCLTQDKNTETKLKASTKVLEELKVIGPSSVNLNINQMSSMSDDELLNLRERTKKIAGKIIDAEIVGE